LCALRSCKAPENVHVLLLLSAALGAVTAGDCVPPRASPLLGESQAGAGLGERTCAFPSAVGGRVSIWQPCLGRSPSCSAWCESLEEIGWGIAFGVLPCGTLQQKCVWRKSLLLSFSCVNLESYCQNLCFVFQKLHFSYINRKICSQPSKKLYFWIEKNFFFSLVLGYTELLFSH